MVIVLAGEFAVIPAVLNDVSRPERSYTTMTISLFSLVY